MQIMKILSIAAVMLGISLLMNQVALKNYVQELGLIYTFNLGKWYYTHTHNRAGTFEGTGFCS
jgi:hypothetical protein